MEMNADNVKQHLNKISKEIGGLICSKCGYMRKYVKTYLHHIKSCGIVLPLNDTMELSVNESVDTSEVGENDTTIHVKKCGVCLEEVESGDWITHIHKRHLYMAWPDGEQPLDVNDPEQVYEHLYSICKDNGGLVCIKCGLVRKYVKVYLQHIQTCEESNEGDSDNDGGTQNSVNKSKEVQCGICFETMNKSAWKSHAMTKHYNIAWIVGKNPLDLRNAYAVEKYLKEYKEKYGKMTCKICKISRVSCTGFYAHILTCGKTEEEVEMYKDTCEICNNKYLCIYKSPHMTMHREQVLAKERKLQQAKEKDNADEEEIEVVETTPGRRKAAQKAKCVIEKYKSNMNNYNHTCSKCGFGADDQDELNNHQCGDNVVTGYSSDSDVSVKLEACSDDESPDSDIDSNISDDEAVADKKKRLYTESKSASSKVERIPFKVKNTSSYLQESYAEFCTMHLTNESLFPQWHNTEYEIVCGDQVAKYLPPLKESCKVKFNDASWTDANLFEAKEIDGYHMLFAGACVQTMSWAPSHVDDSEDSCGIYLAVAAHSGVDQPRFHWEEAPSHPGLLQIWDMSDIQSKLPKLVLGIVHDYGTVWALDWCPSGARDLLPANQEEDGTRKYRLGLLAVACSNGGVYIFSVPYPSTITEKDQLFYKLKPKAELRLSGQAGRDACQATSVSWSSQKGHAIVLVGYSDGTSAFYDVVNESKILRTIEDDVTIFFPFHDEHSQNSCVTEVGQYPSAESGVRCGAWCSASVSGARLSSGGGRGAAVYSHVAAAGARFLPLWPSVLLTGDDSIVSQSVNELEWFGGGRRMGAVRAWDGSARHGRLVASTPPLLRLMTYHPMHKDILKVVLGVIQMSPIAEKRKRQQGNDELAMKVEPLTYHDAVKKYGIEVQMIGSKDMAAQQKALSLPMVHYPERYPLADISSIVFCPNATYQKKLALATHAGVIFIINV